MALIIMFSFFRTVFRRKFAVNILGIKNRNMRALDFFVNEYTRI